MDRNTILNYVRGFMMNVIDDEMSCGKVDNVQVYLNLLKDIDLWNPVKATADEAILIEKAVNKVLKEM